MTTDTYPATLTEIRRLTLARARERRAHLDVSAFSHTAKRILYVLWMEWRWSYGGNCWSTTAALADEIRRTLPETKAALRELREAGVIRHSWMVDEDCTPSGSGYFLTREWDPYP